MIVPPGDRRSVTYPPPAVFDALMEDSRAQEGAIFEALYPGLRRFAGVIRPPGVEPDDLVQEALARTLSVRSLASLDDPLNYLRTAMVRVASNLVRGARRSDARLRNEQPAGDVVDVYPSDLDDLKRTPPRARAVLFLTVIEKQTYREAADIVGCSETAARQIASRALRELRAELRAEAGEPT
jgi:DNA-directed RNA polymerase specialized sigma24 family protein